jgi:ribosomal protein S18 acetylase RimI-like enzyme
MVSGVHRWLRKHRAAGFSGDRVTPPIDSETARRLLRHEAEVHAIPGRILRDLGDALLLYDREEAEPFWNRAEAILWPADPVAFDRRLAEVSVMFAAVGRQPHVWTLTPHDEPADLTDRLLANGFENVGLGCLMVARDAELARRAIAERHVRPEVTIERLQHVTGRTAADGATAIMGVLLEAFSVGPDRGAGVMAETLASLADPRFTHFLVRIDGRPAAVTRSATFDRISYLSSIGTTIAARGQGLGRLVTATAMIDAVAAGSELIHLGVFADNVPARRLYETLGFRMAGDPGADLLLIG